MKKTNTEKILYRGFILTRHWRDTPRGVELEFWLVTDDQPIQLRVQSQQALFFCRHIDQPVIESLIGQLSTVRIQPLDLKTRDGEAVIGVYFSTQRQLRECRDTLTAKSISVWEADIKPTDRFLMERFVTSSVAFTAQSSLQQKKQYAMGLAEKIKASDYLPNLSVISLDIETSLDADQLFSIGIYSKETALVFMVNEAADVIENDASTIRYFSTEKKCLQAFLQWLSDYDPDVIIGWHIVQFDCWVLSQLFQKWRLPFTLGRANQTAYWREDSQHAGRRYIQCPGRMVLDGIELLRMAFYSFENFSLQFVAQQLLGESKLIEEDNRGEAIQTLYESDQLALAKYNLKDCELVWRIFEKTDLLNFAIARSRLTGLAMDRMGGSVASFDYVYLPRLHRSGFIAPNLGELESDVVSPGGYVMRSKPGIYQNILVLDFKSLYPSIIRTFSVDPCAFWQAQLSSNKTYAKKTPGFNGAEFECEAALLPDIIAALWQERDQAKKNNNQPLSQAIKIIMNSFYGVLGSTGCRFFDPRVCSSITLRGHEIIQKSREWIENQGVQVIYGDTDSVFVWLGNDCSSLAAQKQGEQLAHGLNHWWQRFLKETYNIPSYLEIEFETHYRHFFMPTIRNSEEGSKKRYAGLVGEGEKEALVFKGLETVRNDWTELAKVFQKSLYFKIFKKEPFRDLIIQTVDALMAGDLDNDLIYRKRLRRPLFAYSKSNPPHVKACRFLYEQTGVQLGQGDYIEYVITINGPEPVKHRLSAIDYHHYLEKQLRPIADSILVLSEEESFNEVISKQLHLL